MCLPQNYFDFFAMNEKENILNGGCCFNVDTVFLIGLSLMSFCLLSQPFIRLFKVNINSLSAQLNQMLQYVRLSYLENIFIFNPLFSQIFKVIILYFRNMAVLTSQY